MARVPRGSVLVLSLFLALAGSREALAAWPNSPTLNVPVCTAGGAQSSIQALADGSGGMFVVWIDPRTGAFDIYAQRVDAAGAPLWAANGVPVCTATNNQFSPTLISDGAGGVLVTWSDERAGAGLGDIYAQRLSGTGIALWTVNGIVVCNAVDEQYGPRLVSDGAGGAILAWSDARTAGVEDIYAQRMNASGIAQWAANGVVVCNAVGAQWVPMCAGGRLRGRDHRLDGPARRGHRGHLRAARQRLGGATVDGERRRRVYGHRRPGRPRDDRGWRGGGTARVGR